MQLICGINPVLEALSAGSRHFDRLLVVKGIRNRRVAETIARASQRGIPLRFEARETLDRMSGGLPHQGVIAVVSEKAVMDLDGLLADPWPAPPLESVPVLMVRNGTVELIDGAAADAPVMVLRDVSLRAEPTGVGNLMRVEGTARGGPFDRLRFAGTIDRQAGTLELTEADLTGLALSDEFRRCLPDAALRKRMAELARSV